MRIARIFPSSALVAALGCAPSWGPLPGEEVVPGSTKEDPIEFCAALSDYADQLKLAKDVDLPHDLPNVNGASPEHPPGYRKVIREVFAHRGFFLLSEASGPGFVSIGKPLSDGTSLQVSFDVGTWSVSSTATLFITIDGCYTPLSLPPSLGAAERSQYPITGIDQWRMLLENYAASVDFIEQRVGECAVQRRMAGRDGDCVSPNRALQRTGTSVSSEP